jgi:prepilin-type N-terminal cleavage/methylation domain-containing protein
MVKKRAFTLIEIVIVIAIIGILSVGIVSFLDNGEKTKLYQAETCLNEINGKLKNFTNAAMTSKKLQTPPTEVFPEYYIIEFTGTHTILLKYETSTTSGTYQKILLSGGCREGETNFVFSGTLPFSQIRMNKGFRQIKSNELFTFSLVGGATPSLFTGEVQGNFCLDETCAREFVKRKIDTRAQGIFTERCLFYHDDRNTCSQREGENY